MLKNADVLEQKLIEVDQDAKKMPALVQPRAEKRKLIEEELNCSLKVFFFLSHFKTSSHDLLKKM